MVLRDLVDVLRVIDDDGQDEDGRQHEKKNGDEASEHVPVEESGEAQETGPRRSRSAVRSFLADRGFRAPPRRGGPRGAQERTKAPSSTRSARLPDGAGHRSGAQEEEHRVGQPDRDGGSQPALLGPRLAARQQNVVEDDDGERDREARSLSRRAAKSPPAGCPTTANARHAKGIDSFLWISTQASR